MRSMALFYAALGILVFGSHAAPYVDHQDNLDPTTQTETGPEMKELRPDFIHDLFNFMDILLDPFLLSPQSYTTPHYEVRTLDVFLAKIYLNTFSPHI